MTSPLAEISASLGAVYEGVDGANAAAHFGDWQREYTSASERAAVFDCSSLSKVELTGRDRARFLHNLCTNDIKRLVSGTGCESFLTNVQGKILFFVRVFCQAESIWLDTVPGVAAPLLAHLDRYLITEQVNLADRSPQFAQLLVIGPQARECLTGAAAAAVRELSDWGHDVISIAGEKCILIHNTALVRPAYELRIPAGSVAAVWQALWQAGQPYGLRPIGSRAFESLRIEAGWPVYGHDINESNLPQEIGRTERAVSFTKGCYLGQETVARIDALGHVNRHFIGLLIPAGTEPPPREAKISWAAKTIGHITSSAYSPALRHAIALGYVRRGQEQPGTELVIESPGAALRAVVCNPPFLR
jgi:hypothetical protein